MLLSHKLGLACVRVSRRGGFRVLFFFLHLRSVASYTPYAKETKLMYACRRCYCPKGQVSTGHRYAFILKATAPIAHTRTKNPCGFLHRGVPCVLCYTPAPQAEQVSPTASPPFHSLAFKKLRQKARARQELRSLAFCSAFLPSGLPPPPCSYSLLPLRAGGGKGKQACPFPPAFPARTL